MFRKSLHILLFCAPISVFSQADLDPASIYDRYKADANKLIEVATADSAAWNRLAELCDTFGPRFSGSTNLENALDWIVAEMKKDGLENVRKQEVMVPNWQRGEESLVMTSPRQMDLPLLGLGGSVGTPEGGVTAEVMVVSSFEELSERIEEVKGKILLFNAPFTSYGQTVQYRVRGASIAGHAGAVASLIRSVGPFSMITPHTGGMAYEDGAPKIPGAAIAAEHADMLHRMQERGQKVTLHLVMGATTGPDVLSHNVMGEIVGSEFPDEVIVMGGHIDSWDVGQGAMDDGGGSVVAWEAVRLMIQHGMRPKRTVRVVLWTNEENGLRGGEAYRDSQEGNFENHILAIESDAGVFKPQGFGFTGSDEAYMIIEEIGKLLAPIEAGTIRKGGGGADIGPLMREGVPGMGLNVAGEKYFWYHHTAADTVDKLDPREVGLCTATMAVMSFVVADLDQKLPR